MPSIKTFFALYKKGGLSEIYKHYREGDLRYSPKARLRVPESIRVIKPIFFVGVQGGGLSIISRMLRRHRRAVCVTGDSRYWTGGDEMAPRYPLDLPDKLTARFYFYEKFLGEKINSRTFTEEQLLKLPDHYKSLYEKYGLFWWWNYACDDLLSFFYADGTDYDDETAERFVAFLKKIIFVHARDTDTARLVDKSQVFSLKIGLIDRILQDSQPYYVAIARNPYAICYRSATDGYLCTRPLDFEQRLHVAAQHYRNTYQSILTAFSEIPDRRKITLRLEDFLARPKKSLQSICEKVQLEFTKDMLPQPYHKLPFGSTSREKWYPLQSQVNEKYLVKLRKQDVETVDLYCEELIEKFSYQAS
jgi:hypothetical protein